MSMLERTLCILCALAWMPSALCASSIEERIRTYADEGIWKAPKASPVIERSTLNDALDKARTFYLFSQKKEGNFIYQLDLSTGRIVSKDQSVRQAGALWGLASLNRERFNEPTRLAVDKGLMFFASQTRMLKNGKKCAVYPGETRINTGMVALYCLSLIEYLRGQGKYISEAERMRYIQQLNIHLAYLQSMEMPNGSWAKCYEVAVGLKIEEESPYYDGEALLAYCKAARYMGHRELLPRIQMALPKLIEKYTVNVWSVRGGDEALSKGFYQWCCMAMNEYVEAGWQPHRQLAADTAIAYSYWQIYCEHVAVRNGNTGYAVEGLVSSWNVARLTGNAKAREVFRKTIFEIMSKLMQWQCGGPFQQWNPALSQLKPEQKEKYLGGIIINAVQPVVRIDVHQHQTHAMLLMLQYLFPAQQDIWQ